MESTPFKVFAGTQGEALARRVCDELHCPLGKIKIDHFSDGEFAISYDESVRGQSVYLIQSTCHSSDSLMELLLMIDAAKRASAYKVVAVIPYFGWARQDRKDIPRVSVASKLVANMIEKAGADRIITFDLHAGQIEAFFDIPVDNLYAANLLAEYIKQRELRNYIVASPDVGGAKRASAFAKKIHILTHLDLPIVICYKNRPNFNKVGEINILGDVKGKDVLIIDDIADTAGTLCAASQKMIEQGATSVSALVTHGLFSGDACDKISNSVLKELVCTDTIPFDSVRCAKVQIVSVASTIAQMILAIQEHRSVSELNIH